MTLLLDIESQPFVIFTRGERIVAQQVNSAREYLLYELAELHPAVVERALFALVTCGALDYKQLHAFEAQYLQPKKQAA
jgi:hypothetical protein